MSEALLSYSDAAAFIAKTANRLARIKPSVERVTLAASANRVLAETLRADTDQPPFARSTRDGYACRAVEISTHRSLAVVGSTRAGDPPSGSLPKNSVWEIMTGAPIPRGADAVVMLEHIEFAHVEHAGPSAVPTIRLLPPRTIRKGENIILRAAQARKGQALLQPGTLIGAAQIGLAASCGARALKAYAKPRVAILSTGDELVPIAARPAPGQIRNSSAAMLAAMVTAAGGSPWKLPIARDTNNSLDRALARAAQADLLLITGGVSAGKFDLVEPALARLGGRFHFTGVRIQPGKPVVFGELSRSTAANQKRRSTQCFGLPGNPVSSAVTFLLFAAPILAALAGRSARGPQFVNGVFDGRTMKNKKAQLTRFLPAVCTFSAPHPKVSLVNWQGSGDLAAMARANCYLVVPEDAASLKSGATVTILLP